MVSSGTIRRGIFQYYRFWLPAESYHGDTIITDLYFYSLSKFFWPVLYEVWFRVMCKSGTKYQLDYFMWFWIHLPYHDILISENIVFNIVIMTSTILPYFSPYILALGQLGPLEAEPPRLHFTVGQRVMWALGCFLLQGKRHMYY